MPWPFTRTSPTFASPTTEETSSSPRMRFAFRLFRELVRTPDSPNVFFSPSSVMLCLTLVHELASGETRKNMAHALEIAGLTSKELKNEITSLKSAFSPRLDAEVAFANSVWLGKHARIAEELAAKLRGLYESELTTLDFASADAVPTINGWVQTKTRGKISQIVDQLSPRSALLAINAVYFKGVWVNPFKREMTEDGLFTVEGRSKLVPMMLQSGTYTYYEDQQLQMAALPYKGGLSMYVILPAAGTDERKFPQSVTCGSWESWWAQSKRMEGTILLPRFKLDYNADLNSVLKILGMESAFDPNRAEFGPIQTDQPPVWIDRVIHRAVAEVNEEGTEAAAVTAAVMYLSAAPRRAPRTFGMIVNRPFLAVIRDEAAKTILFIGWIADPK